MKTPNYRPRNDDAANPHARKSLPGLRGLKTATTAALLVGLLATLAYTGASFGQETDSVKTVNAFLQNGNLRVRGVVEPTASGVFAESVTIYSGSADGSGCTGTALGTTTVNDEGRFFFRCGDNKCVPLPKANAPITGSPFCVQSALGGFTLVSINPIPHSSDPSRFTGPLIEDLPEGRPEANEGAFVGGRTGTSEDAGDANSVLPEVQREDGVWNIPTNGPPSPLFGAGPWEQQMLRFEEFGPRAVGSGGNGPLANFPAPPDAYSSPDGLALENFLAQDRLDPDPTVFANTKALNPWQAEIEAYLDRPLITPPAEGRPPGQGWSHQRWSEFPPQVWFQSAMAGSRVNHGFRDNLQDHGYAVGEFAPGGLYHNTAGVPGLDGTTNGVRILFHPTMPEQLHDALWTFDGTLPPKLLQARYGETVLFRHYNALPIDVATNRGFGVHTITTHEHNGHSPAESDGYANAFYFPGQFYDYRWPMQLAGHDSINTDASDPRPVDPTAHGGITQDTGRLARDDEHPLVPRPHARLHGPECLQGQCGHDELLQRPGSRQRRAGRRRQPALPERHGAGLGQPRLRRQPGHRRQGLGSRGSALVQPVQQERLPGRPPADELALQALSRGAGSSVPLSAS